MLRWMRMVTVFCVLGLVIQSSAEEPKGHRRIELEDGDTLVFCGDSITHQCLYSQYVETFFYTRYPERRIRFHNASVGGDRVGDALAGNGSAPSVPLRSGCLRSPILQPPTVRDFFAFEK